MAEALERLRQTGATPVTSAPTPIDTRRQERLARTIEGQLARGYRIESQSETEAVLVRNARRWFGLFGGGETREVASINQWGHPSIPDCKRVKSQRPSQRQSDSTCVEGGV